MTKKRTLNELRQSKTFGYKRPVSHFKNVDNSPKVDPRYICELCEKFPNDYDLGNEVRKYYLYLKNN